MFCNSIIYYYWICLQNLAHQEVEDDDSDIAVIQYMIYPPPSVSRGEEGWLTNKIYLINAPAHHPKHETCTAIGSSAASWFSPSLSFFRRVCGVGWYCVYDQRQAHDFVRALIASQCANERADMNEEAVCWESPSYFADSSATYHHNNKSNNNNISNTAPSLMSSSRSTASATNPVANATDVTEEVMMPHHHGGHPQAAGVKNKSVGRFLKSGQKVFPVECLDKKETLKPSSRKGMTLRTRARTASSFLFLALIILPTSHVHSLSLLPYIMA